MVLYSIFSFVFVFTFNMVFVSVIHIIVWLWFAHFHWYLIFSSIIIELINSFFYYDHLDIFQIVAMNNSVLLWIFY